MIAQVATRPSPAVEIGKAQALTVGELRRRLATMDDSLVVLLPGPEGGFSALSDVEALGIVFNVNADPQFGPHDVPAPGQRRDGVGLVLLPAAANL